VKTARNPNALNHNRSTKKRLNTKNVTKTATIDATSMRDPFFIIEFLPRTGVQAGTVSDYGNFELSKTLVFTAH
jgi:hypothetical protein